jgi:long-chain acyl-CoA synthetase
VDRVWLNNYPPGVPTDIDPDQYASLREVLEEAFAAHGHRIAYRNLGATLSYAQLETLSRAFAAWLQRKSGLAHGERVAVMLPNILQYPIALFGILRAGMVVVNVNPLYTARELEHQLVDSGAKAIVILENFAHVLQSVLPRTALKHVLVTGVGDLLGWPRGMLVNFVLRHVRKQVPAWRMPGASTFKSVLSSGLGLKLEAVELGPNDIAFLQYTGGTTGVAKAAVLTHRNMVANILQAGAWIRPALEQPAASRVVITSSRSPRTASCSCAWAPTMC